MKQFLIHPWELSPSEFSALQSKLAHKVVREDSFDHIRHIAGADVAYDEEKGRIAAAVVLIDIYDFEIIETVTVKDIVPFPYIPGLFSFRELPAITKALKQLNNSADLIICDGHGLAHPRRFGLASHLGVLFDVPTIGCGKTKLWGEYAAIGTKRGDYAPLTDGDETIGNVLRTQDNVKPVYVSIGHRVSLETACMLVLMLAPDYRLPQTTRFAHKAANKALKC